MKKITNIKIDLNIHHDTNEVGGNFIARDKDGKVLETRLLTSEDSISKFIKLLKTN